MAYRDDLTLGIAEARWFTARGSALSDSRRNVVEFQSGSPACSEIDCIRGRLPRRTVVAAERRAAELGIGADRVLISEGAISEDAYLVALAASLGIEHETLDELPREACPLDDHHLIEAAAAGLLPLHLDGRQIWVIAPRNLTARTLTTLMARNPGLVSRIRLTSTARLNRFIAVHGCQALGARADETLFRKWPHLSATPRPWRLPVTLAIIATAVPAALVAFPEQTMMAGQAGLAAGFLAWLLLRFVGSFIALPPPRPIYLSDGMLPVYSIIIALYHEAEAVDGLVAALRELDYPPEKLDIKLVIEADDLETWAALSRLKLEAPFEIVIAPNIGPRTKPKALNAALPFAHGTFTAVFDAEDRPEADQLRRVLAVFLAGGNDLACVQARLTIDNTTDNWLSRLFTAEYAAQFDLFLPGLAALALPLPLGGSSNHFRTAVLREVGAWDPYNVTEDADLGTRLARFGYRTMVANSTTYEEAPGRLGPWLRQRTRWFKGWMRTWAVHMRSPRRLIADLGPAGFASFQLVVGGSVLAALIHPIFLAGVVYTVIAGIPVLGTNGSLTTTLAWLYGTTLGAGYLTSIVLGLRGLAHRGLLSAAWALALVPLHWMLLSLAAWRALGQLCRDPHSWEKTAHGLARSSRLAKQTSAATLDAVFRDTLQEREPQREAAE